MTDAKPTPGLTERDRSRLARVDSRLVRVLHEGLLDEPGLYFVSKGASSVVDELENMRKGTSRVKDPYSSKHVIGPRRPLATAADCIPTGFQTVESIPNEAWLAMANCIKNAALRKGVQVKWGWDLWKWDKAHFQLVE
jgi:hypothetical protein